MNTRILLAIVATTAALTIMTSSIGVGIFSQHANAAKPPGNPGAAVLPTTCVGQHVLTGKVVKTPSGQINLSCHS